MTTASTEYQPDAPVIMQLGDGPTTEVTRVAFDNVWKQRGYTEVDEAAAARKAEQEAAAAQEANTPVEKLLVPALKQRAKDAGVEGYSTMKRDELVLALGGTVYKDPDPAKTRQAAGEPADAGTSTE